MLPLGRTTWNFWKLMVAGKGSRTDRLAYE